MYPAASASAAAILFDTIGRITKHKLIFSLLYFNEFLQLIVYITKFKMSGYFGVVGSAFYRQDGQASDGCSV